MCCQGVTALNECHSQRMPPTKASQLQTFACWVSFATQKLRITFFFLLQWCCHAAPAQQQDGQLQRGVVLLLWATSNPCSPNEQGDAAGSGPKAGWRPAPPHMEAHYTYGSDEKVGVDRFECHWALVECQQLTLYAANPALNAATLPCLNASPYAVQFARLYPPAACTHATPNQAPTPYNPC